MTNYLRKRGRTAVICDICRICFLKRNDSIKSWKGTCQKCSGIRKRKEKPPKKGPTRYWLGKKRPDISERMKNQKRFFGEQHHNWIKDRSLVKNKQDRNNPEYKQWRTSVWRRDSFICKLKDKDCSGKIEAHHIKSWSNHPEFRYQINNGITLCHAHHPRKRAEEKRLEPLFMELVSVSNL